MPEDPDGAAPIDPWLDRWARAGLIDDATVAAIRRYEANPQPTPVAAPAHRSRALATVAEVLAYIGAALALAGVILVVVREWRNLETWVRIALPGAVVIVLLAIGAGIPERDPVRTRLRAVLWLAAGGAAVVLGVVLARDVLGTTYGGTVACWGASLGFLVSATCWRWQRRPLQQAATLIALAVALGTAVDIVGTDGSPGFILWPLGVLYLALGVTRRTPDRFLTEAIGAGVLFAATITFATQWSGFGSIAMVVTGLGLVAGALARTPVRATGDAIVFGAAGGFILLQGAPGAIGYFAQEAGIVTGLVVWGVGALAIGIGLARVTRIPRIVETVGGFVLLLGAAVTGAQAAGFATVFGLATATGLLVLGMFPGRILLTLSGSLGLLVFVPWLIAWYFPGANRAPLLIAVAGLLVLLVGLLLGRSAGRFREELAAGRPESRPA